MQHVAPKAYFHTIYHPLTFNDIESLEATVGANFPIEFTNFLLKTNGLNIFSSNVSIYGLRKLLNRSDIEGMYQPYDFISENHKVPNKIKDEFYIFGSYREGFDLYFQKNQNLNTSKVFLRERNSETIIKEYSSFKEWLNKSIEVMSKLFNEKGELLIANPKYKTGPLANIVFNLDQLI